MSEPEGLMLKSRWFQGVSIINTLSTKKIKPIDKNLVILNPLISKSKPSQRIQNI